MRSGIGWMKKCQTSGNCAKAIAQSAGNVQGIHGKHTFRMLRPWIWP